ncbi:MAG: hypothetical protein H7062_01565 [Candidatus Saccharimonas sp.]|nr:hypothetical protein [Planctomycetaceae bacterium]
MLTLPSASVWPATTSAIASSNPVLVLDGPAESFVVDRDRLRIGSSPVCDLLLPDVPALHSVVHQQAGVTWIETHDDASLIVNGRARRRMALRDGDVLDLNGHELTVNFRTTLEAEEMPVGLGEDLSLLSAEELCDRILSEQTMVDEFEESQCTGWNGLMAAITAAHEADQSPVALPLEIEQAVEAAATPDDCERLLVQIRELSEMVNGRSQELDDCESELVAATALLEEAQERVSQQIEGLLEQLQTPPAETELRASA